MNEEQIKKSISSNMMAIMKNDSLTESDISNATGISQAAINRIKNGNVCASIYQIFLIAKALRVDINELIGNKSEGNQNKDYVPVFDANKSLDDQPEIKGLTEDPVPGQCEERIGLVVDKSFTSNLLSQGSVVIIQKQYDLKNGDTVLFKKNNGYRIGIFRDNSIASMDNLFSKIPINQISLVGQVVKIQKEYVKSKSMLQKLMEAKGEQRFYKAFQKIMLAN